MHVRFIMLFLLMGVFFDIQAKQGVIRGQVFDAGNGEPIPGVTIAIVEKTIGTFSDLDGKFNLSVESGTYTLKMSYMSYETVVLTDVKVNEDEVTLLEPVNLSEAAMILSGVTVSAKLKRNTENALIVKKRTSANVMDGISADKLKKTGDSDAASSMKRITGVSVEGGKYVFVRGLGDRYTKTILNGVDIPGLDPDRNSLQLDIFPSNILDNIVVHKSFSAQLPADFTGGVVDITLKDFPEEKQGAFSIGFGYNPSAHFNENYLTYEGGKYDFLGFDDGTRAIPATKDVPFWGNALGDPDGETGLRYKEVLGDFNPNMAAIKQKSFMDVSSGLSFGNQIVRPKATYGYNFALSYKNNVDFYEDAEFGRYGLAADKTVNELETRQYWTGDYGIDNVLLSVMGGFAVKTLKNKYMISFLHLQNGESRAGIFDYTRNEVGTTFDSYQHVLDYQQSSLTNVFINGQHIFNDPTWKVIWKISPTYSTVLNPDIRFTRYQIDKEDPEFINIGTEVGLPQRVWRDLHEYSVSGNTQATKDFDFNNRPAKIDFGAAFTYKQRDFIVRRFDFNINNIPLTGNPDEIFYEENLWPYQDVLSSGVTYDPDFLPRNPNQFNATTQNIALFFSTELSFTAKLKSVLGVRAENYQQRYTGENYQGTVIYDNELVMDEIGIFPSLNMIYALDKVQNIRFSYARTTARPSFKELSYAEIFDPISATPFVGGLHKEVDNSTGTVFWDGNLRSSFIHNLDLRYEFLKSSGRMLSISAFYKYIQDPIEIVQWATENASLQPRNVGDGQLYGIELESMQCLDLLTPSLKNLSLVGNFSLIESIIQLSETEYASKVSTAREGQVIEKERNMAGQAPYLINAGISFSGDRGLFENFEAGLYYNVQGKTLLYVGVLEKPDVYVMPFESLNLNITKKIGKEDRFQIGFKVDNILNDKKETKFISFDDEQYFSAIYQGTTFSLSASYNFY